MKIEPLSKEYLVSTKFLIAEVVLEFYSDLEFFPKTIPALLEYYEKTGYLKDVEEFETEYSSENGGFQILIEGSNVIGCGGLRRLDQNNGELVRLWLKKKNRGIGLGRKMFDLLMDLAINIGYENVYLDTSHRCVEAVKLFRQNGFSNCPKYKESIADLYLFKRLNIH